MSFAHRSRLLLCAGTLVAAGCSDNATSPSSPNLPDVASLLVEMSPAKLSAVASLAEPIVGASLQSIGTPDPAKCPYAASTGFFVCPAVTTNGLTFTEMFRLIDDAGNSQATPDAQTSAIETKSTVTGTLTSTPAGGSAPSTYNVDGSSDQTLSGIRTDKHTLNGITTTHVTGALRIGTVLVPLDEKTTETTTNLVLPNTKAGQKWPQSGTVTVDVSRNPNDPQLTEVLHMQVAFDGTSVVTVTVTDYFGTRSCKVDLATSTGFASCLS
jgi:hypothetical protein